MIRGQILTRFLQAPSKDRFLAKEECQLGLASLVMYYCWASFGASNPQTLQNLQETSACRTGILGRSHNLQAINGNTLGISESLGRRRESSIG